MIGAKHPPTGQSDRDYSTTYSTDFLDQTIIDWQPFADHDLIQDDAREIVENLCEFFMLLDEWDRADHERDALIGQVEGEGDRK